MYQNIGRALQQGLTAHKEGKLQEAERQYRAVLKLQPAHPDANHNLGVIAVSVNKIGAALPLLKTALEANPKIEQFWVSYIDALVKANRFQDAKVTIKKAKKRGFDSKRLQALLFQFKAPSKEQLNNLFETYQKGQLDDAEKLASLMIREFPEHGYGWKVLGAIFKQTGRLIESLKPFQKSVQMAPQDPEAHINLANALRELGRLEEAEASYRKAIVLRPDFAEAHSNLGVTLQELHRLDEAQTSHNRAITLRPSYAKAHNNLGNTLKEIGSLNKAIASYLEAIKLTPDFAEAHNNLGIALKELRRLEEAKASFLTAIALKPNYAKAHSNLGNTLKEMGNLDAAIASYLEAIKLTPDFVEVHNNLGIALKELGRLDEAEFIFKQAIALSPSFAQTYFNLCDLLVEINRADELLSFIRSVPRKILEKSSSFLYYEALAEFRKENYEAAAELLEALDINEVIVEKKSAAIKLQGDVLHHNRNFKGAFDAYKAKNKYIMNSYEYKKQQPEKYFIQQRAKITQIKNLQEKTPYVSATKKNWFQPTFLIGFPRSGTTLLDTILRTHSNIDVLEELPMVNKIYEGLGYIPSVSDIEAMGEAELETAANFYFNEVKKHTKVGTKKVLVDKLPLNIFHLPLINKVFPNSKYIIALRHPLDCVLSCWMQDFKLNPAMANMIRLERAVELYDTAMSLLQLSEDRYSLETHRVRYEDLVVDVESTISSLLHFLGLKWETDLENYQKTALARGRINTPSSSQVIKPIYQTASYRWMCYEEFLRQQKTQLAHWIQEYGY